MQESSPKKSPTSLTADIMPLVEENRALHQRVNILKGLLEEQNVRMDTLLSAGRLAPKWVDVTISDFEQYMSPRQTREAAILRLAETLMDRTGDLAFKVYPDVLSNVTYRFPFLGVK